MVGQKGGIAIANGDVGGGVFHFFDGLHLVAQLLQRFHDQQGLECFFGNRAFQGQHRDALAGQISSVCAQAGQGQGGGNEGGAEKFVHQSLLFNEVGEINAY